MVGFSLEPLFGAETRPELANMGIIYYARYRRCMRLSIFLRRCILDTPVLDWRVYVNTAFLLSLFEKSGYWYAVLESRHIEMGVCLLHT
jgi:hypothetical protein